MFKNLITKCKNLLPTSAIIGGTIASTWGIVKASIHPEDSNPLPTLMLLVTGPIILVLGLVAWAKEKYSYTNTLINSTTTSNPARATPTHSPLPPYSDPPPTYEESNEYNARDINARLALSPREPSSPINYTTQLTMTRPPYSTDSPPSVRLNEATQYSLTEILARTINN